MSGPTAARSELEKPHIASSFRVPDHSEDEDDVEAQHSVGTESDGSGESAEIPVEGGMTVAFKVHSSSLSHLRQPALTP